MKQEDWALKKIFRVALMAGLLAAASLGMAAGGVAAYGAADSPLAQIEVSANCDNPTFPLCDPNSGVGLGGIWLWIEIDAGNTADVAGSACTHTIGSGGNGAHSIRGEFSWWGSTGPQGFPMATDPYNLYYNVPVGGGPTLAFPQTQGHYSFHPAPGVSIQVTVAP